MLTSLRLLSHWTAIRHWRMNPLYSFFRERAQLAVDLRDESHRIRFRCDAVVIQSPIAALGL